MRRASKPGGIQDEVDGGGAVAVWRCRRSWLVLAALGLLAAAGLWVPVGGEAAAGHFVEAADYCRTIEEQGLSLFHGHPNCKILPAHCHCLDV